MVSGMIRKFWKAASWSNFSAQMPAIIPRAPNNMPPRAAKSNNQPGATILSSVNHKVAKSTKGRAALNPFVERVMDWLTENYAPPAEALDSERFKVWRDTIYPSGGPDNFIDYLVTINVLKPKEV